MALADSITPPYPQIKKRWIFIGPFKYLVTEFGEYHTLEAGHTGEKVEFDSRVAFASFVDALTAHIHNLYPDDTTPDDPKCPNCGRRARRMVANPLDADRQICWRCAAGIADELAAEVQEWRYDRSPVGL